LIRRDYVAN
jgi:elongator complex protein 3